jgi:hypothetical protein
MKISENFDVREFVTREIFLKFKENSKWFVSKQQLEFAEFLRSHFDKPIIINNWLTGGDLDERGTRNPNASTGATYSQHKIANALDFNVKGMTSDEVYDHILAHEKEFMAAGLTTMEDSRYTRGWTHCDFRITGLDKILIVKP